jgi:hypothetical protein
MKRSFVLYQHILERLASAPEMENIILGTGKLAREMQNKLQLLNLKTAPFLVGGADDEAGNIWSYTRLSTLENVEKCRFIVCFDVDEYALISPAQAVIYERLGLVSLNHPQLLRLMSDLIPFEIAGEQYSDPLIQNVILQNNKPYAMYGSTELNAFQIHVMGGCNAGSILSYPEYSWPELLAEKLNNIGFASAIYSWGRPNTPISDSLLQFIRDGQALKPNLLILYSGVGDSETNVLSIRFGVSAHEYTRRLITTFQAERKNGLMNSATPSEVFEIQHRIFRRLSKIYNFEFWNIIPPTGDLLPEIQSRQLLGLSKGYLARKRQKKDMLITQLGNSNVLDYTDSFINETNVFELFTDRMHLSDKGAKIIAERCFNEIITAFAKP